MSGRVWLGFAGLCIISGSGWLLDEWQPSELDAARQLFLASVVLAGLFTVSATLTRAWPTSARGWWRLLKLGGTGVILLTPVALLPSGSGVSSTARALIFCSVPAIVVFIDGQSAGVFGQDRNLFALLLPALGGLMGAGLILPFSWPAGASSEIRLVLVVLAAFASGIAVIGMHRTMKHGEERMRVLPSLAMICGMDALAAAPFSVRGTPWQAATIKLELVRIAVYQLPIYLLTGWLLREMSPPAFATRAFLSLLVTILESYMLLRPQMAWTTGLGLLLLGGAAIGLLRADSEELSVKLD